jgi:hypothetical protein
VKIPDAMSRMPLTARYARPARTRYMPQPPRPGRLVLAWDSTSTDPLIRAFTRIAAAGYRPAGTAK